jgi:membrane protease YdiL (CAAX protease family)
MTIESGSREKGHGSASWKHDERKVLVLYFLATMAWSWSFWIPTVYWHGGTSLEDMTPAFYTGTLAGAYGPSLMAIVFAALLGGRPGVRGLLSKFRIWRVGLRWFAFVLLMHPLLRLAVYAIYDLKGGDLGRVDLGRGLLIPIALLAAAPFGPLAEELGWRGFALPRLLSRHGALASSFVLGAIWTLWHAPLFWAPAGTAVSGAPVTVANVGAYLVFLLAMSVLFTWVYQHTGGSVLLAFLFHLSLSANIHNLFFPDLTVELVRHLAKLSLLPLVILVLLVMVRERKAWGLTMR